MGVISHFVLPCFLAGTVLAHTERDLSIRINPSDRGSAGDRISNEEVCWERCFQVEETDMERFREVYDDFYRMGMEARRLKNIFGVNGTALLIDSTLAQFHATKEAVLEEDDRASEMWKFQKNIASIIAFLTGSDNDHNPFYVEQFNEDSA